MYKRTILLALIGFLSITVYGEKRDIHILAVNDMHANIDVFPQLGPLIDSLRNEDPSLLVFSAGDNRTGNPVNDKYRIPAYPMVALMNLVGFNGTTLGNHEFDAHSLSRIIGLSHFSYICANVFPSDSVNMRLVPYQVYCIDTLRIGVIGAIQLTPQGIPSTHPDNLKGISFKPAKEVLPEYEWLSRECDATILLSHLGYPDDIEMANTFPWLDLIIGGHTHTQLKGDEYHNGILVTQNKNKFGRVTYITLTIEDGKVIGSKAEYIDVKKSQRKSGLIEAMIAHFNDDPRFRRVLATAETPFETPEELGCLMCDAFIDKFDADIAVENPGGVRIDSHPAGDITVRDVLEMDPFDNNAVILNLTGYELVKMMLTYCHNTLFSFPFVGGMKCELTLEPGNKKVKSVKLLHLNGKPLNMKKKYRVVTNSYIPATSEIPEGSAHTVNNQTTDVVMEYLEKKGIVNYQGVSRLKIIPCP